MKDLLAKPSALALTVASIAIRLLPHPANFTPLGATALFGGSKLNRPWNYLAPVFILFVTDLFLGFHATMPYVYGCFLVSVLLGEIFLKESVTTAKLTTLAIVNSTIFFIVTNFGVWLHGGLYPHTFTGLTESYVLGLPFWRNMLAGDIIFSLGIFGLYHLAEKQPNWQQFDNQLAVWLVKSR